MAALCLLGLPLALSSASAEEMNQRDTQLHNRQVNDRGSDESLRNSSVYAMQALMDLASTKLPSAVSNGYKAYGKFRNSENLDRLKDRNARNANSLASVDSATPTLPTKTVTSFRRLDPAFLRQGESGRVAAEFERQTGMKREDFLTHMADISEKKIKRSDPQMIDKAFVRFEDFIDKIPNREFRKKLEKNVAMVPTSVRRGMVSSAVAKLAGFFADAGPQQPPSDLALPSNAPAAPAVAASSATTPAPEAVRVPASGQAASEETVLGALTAASAGAARPQGQRDELLSNVVAAAIATGQSSVKAANQEASEDPTIFQQVTKRYRALTPALTRL